MVVNLELMIAESEEEREQVFQIRRIVFMQEQMVDPEIEFDGMDDHAVLVLGKVEGLSVGCFRILDEGEGVAHPGRLAVLPQWRGKGLGKQLMWYCVELMQDLGFKKAIIHAQLYLQRFYEEFGFVRSGDVFLEADIEHVIMYREL